MTKNSRELRCPHNNPQIEAYITENYTPFNEEETCVICMSWRINELEEKLNQLIAENHALKEEN